MNTNAYNKGDAALSKSKALPDGAANVTTDAIDLGHENTGHFIAATELEVEAPALATAELPDTETMTYDVIASANSDLSSPETIATALITQTGADSAGAAAATKRLRLPTDVKRYIGVKATNSGAGDASGKSVKASLLF